jgi:hypothetical protein
MNAQVKRHRSVRGHSRPKSSTPVAISEPLNTQFCPAPSKHRSIPSKDRQRVDPLWMITAAAAALFAFLAVAVSFS